MPDSVGQNTLFFYWYFDVGKSSGLRPHECVQTYPHIVEKLQRLEYEGKSIHCQNTELILNDDKTLTLKSLIKLGEEEPILLEMTTAVVVEERRKIQFVDVVYQGDERSKALGEALVNTGTWYVFL